MIKLAGGQPVAVSLSAADNYQITEEALRAKITPFTKAIMLNTPSNPTGRVLTWAELKAITKVVIEHDLYVIADEIYEKLVFDDHKHVSVGSLPGMGERTLTINGLSKAYAMTGWRLGWLAGPTPIMKAAAKMNSQTVSSAANFTMHAAVAALQGPQDCVLEMRDAYKARRDFLVKALNEVEGVACQNIEGAFYLFPTFPGSSKNSMDLAEGLLDHAGIAGTPGIAFGNSGEGHMRFSIATAMDDLERAAERLAKTAHKLF
jgi:aspartate aminotransferase